MAMTKHRRGNVAWEVQTRGDLFTFSGGYSASGDQLSTEGHRYLRYGEIHGATKTCVDTCADYQDIPKRDISLKRVSHETVMSCSRTRPRTKKEPAGTWLT